MWAQVPLVSFLFTDHTLEMFNLEGRLPKIGKKGDGLGCRPLVHNPAPVATSSVVWQPRTACVTSSNDRRTYRCKFVRDFSQRSRFCCDISTTNSHSPAYLQHLFSMKSCLKYRQLKRNGHKRWHKNANTRKIRKKLHELFQINISADTQKLKVTVNMRKKQ